MFDISLARTKAGFIGQVTRYGGGNILWESEPQPSEVIEHPEDRLCRVEDLGAEKARQLAKDKINAVLEGLFA